MQGGIASCLAATFVRPKPKSITIANNMNRFIDTSIKLNYSLF